LTFPFGVLRAIGRVVLPPLGRIGKGKATATGVGLVAVVTAIHASLPDLLSSVQAVVDSLTLLVQTVGATMAVFGVGRKAGSTLG
jgi:hypothetical protein